jgi:hypothetical protein
VIKILHLWWTIVDVVNSNSLRWLRSERALDVADDIAHTTVKFKHAEYAFRIVLHRAGLVRPYIGTDDLEPQFERSLPCWESRAFNSSWGCWCFYVVHLVVVRAPF